MRLLIAAFLAFLLSGFYTPPLAAVASSDSLAVYRDVALKILFAIIVFESLLGLRRGQYPGQLLRIIMATVFATLILGLTAPQHEAVLGWSSAEAQAYRMVGLILLSLWTLVESILYWRKANQVKIAPVAAVPVQKAFTPAVKEEPPPFGEVVVLLSLLQEKGRFLDFLAEDITKFNDAQVAAASRVVHQGCASILREYFSVSPAHDAKEGQSVSIDRSADPSHYRLLGKVTGDAPYHGKLVHRGWKTSKISLPRSAKAIDPNATNIITPAEIELK